MYAIFKSDLTADYLKEISYLRILVSLIFLLSSLFLHLSLVYLRYLYLRQCYYQSLHLLYFLSRFTYSCQLHFIISIYDSFLFQFNLFSSTYLFSIFILAIDHLYYSIVIFKQFVLINFRSSS